MNKNPKELSQGSVAIQLVLLCQSINWCNCY